MKSHPILDIESEPDIVRFNFNGTPVISKKGEMISSALFAQGIHIFGHHHKDGSPQGIYCANGQCAQCLVLVDGIPVKSCITPVEEGMEVRSMEGLPELIDDDIPLEKIQELPITDVEVLIIGGGPAGMSAAGELGKLGVDCIICDDKQELGGKLSLQTHNFFGSRRDCFAGSRGMEIGHTLESLVNDNEHIQVWTNSPVVGVFADGLVGVLSNGEYKLVRPKRLLVATGAREKTLAFPGCDLPGVYGAGAFQTIVNRDLIEPTEKLFIVGGGNVGLIGAYHALQAGIDVLGIVEALPQCGGYKVHLDKVLRLGIPVYTSHTVLRAEGSEHLERVIICEIDEKFRPIEGTEIEFEADTLLIAVGLAPVNELRIQAEAFGIKTYAAGDADIIAEASAAIFSGRITGRRILQDMGFDVEVPPEWEELVAILRSKPGPTKGYHEYKGDNEVFPIIRCSQEIPCNPCTEACVLQSIKIKETDMMGRPQFDGDCLGCLRCVSICPGLAITLVDKGYDPSSESVLVIVPWEMPEGAINVGQEVQTTDMEGQDIGPAKVIAIKKSKWQDRRALVSLEAHPDIAYKIAGIRLKETMKERAPKTVEPTDDKDIIICRCERVTKEDIIKYLEENGTMDLNALKAALRIGMGPCGGKTCTELVLRVYRELGIEISTVEPHVERPFTQEVPLASFLRREDC
jgi:NADPH-dependent 2,4-dienoyl-CoA reductase/sulfur reductase-like enzyme/Fe-S-cluster-containing hydrogenase component 2